MVTDNGDIREERDNNLANAFADRARGLMYDYGSWIEDEIRDCQTKIEAIETLVGDVSVTDELKAARDAMDHMLRSQLPNAKKIFVINAKKLKTALLIM